MLAHVQMQMSKENGEKREQKRGWGERERERIEGGGRTESATVPLRAVLRQSDYYRDKNKTPFARQFLSDARLSVKRRDIKIFQATPY